jgi:HPt (histidine-containing phosphotransfer) domain-containing protein
MTRQIDIDLFAQTTGGLDILAAVAKPFLLQLAPWRKAIDKHTRRFDTTELTSLVHKMKGSCFVVAAVGAATALHQAEMDLRGMDAVSWQQTYTRLMGLMKDIEAELQEVILAQAPHQ